MTNDLKLSKKAYYYSVPTIAILMLLSYAFWIRYGAMIYRNVDDKTIQDFLSGFFTGTPDPAAPYMSVFLGYPLTILYKVFPAFQWWYIHSQIAMFIGTAVFLFYIMNRGLETKTKLFLALMISVLFLVLFFIPGIGQTCFTIVPAFWGICGICLIVSYYDSEKHNKLYLLLVFLVLLLGCFHRLQSGLVSAGYASMILLYMMLMKADRIWKTVLKWMIIVASFLVIIFVLNFADVKYRESLDGDYYNSYRSGMAVFVNWPMDTYDENPEAYNSAGWDRDTYLMARNYCFIDESLTPDSFEYVVQNCRKDLPLLSVVRDFWDRKPERHVLIGTLSLLFVLYGFIIACKDKLRILFGGFDIAVTVLFLIYLIIIQRIVYRAIVATLIPSVVVMAILVIESKLDLFSYIKDRKPLRLFFLLVVVILVGRSLKSGINLTNHLTVRDKVSNDALQNRDDIINRYLFGHEDNTYILQLGALSNGFPLLNYPGKNILNTILWGESNYPDHAYREKFKKAKIESLTSRVFMNDKVFFVSQFDYDENNDGKDLASSGFYAFVRKMKKRYPEKKMVKVDTICDQAYVYKFE